MEKVKEINWPAWCIALSPLLGITPYAQYLNIPIMVVILGVLWFADFKLNKPFDIFWLTIIGALIFPPTYLWMRKDYIKSSMSIFYASIVAIIIPTYIYIVG